MLKMAEKLIENIGRGQEMDSKQYITDLAYQYISWDDRSTTAKGGSPDMSQPRKTKDCCCALSAIAEPPAMDL